MLAAANPLYGRYNTRKSLSENVDLPNSLLSRFDLLFLILDKASLDNDLALSRHVLHVHKYRKKPDHESEPLSPESMKEYIAAARSLDPVIPKDVSSYIIEAYVSLRCGDGSGPAALRSQKAVSNDQATMTPRQLLSILRLSQALARLRFSEKVTRDDVEESIRLTHASRASLLDDSSSKSTEDSVSIIFSAIRDLSNQLNAESMNYVTVVAAVLRKGFTEQQLSECIEENENLGVLSVDSDKNSVTLL